MAKFVLTDAKVTINGTDLSNSLTSIEFSDEVDDKETTTFGTTYRTRVGGLKQGSVKLDFLQDFGAAAVYATVNPLLGTIATVVVLPTSGTASATNPQRTYPCLVTSTTFVSGAVGDVATMSVTWPTSGSVTVTP